MTVAKNIDIIPRLLAAHALSGCDTAAPYHGIGKLKVIKKLREGAYIEVLGHSPSCVEMAIEQTCDLISDCFKSRSMTDCRIQAWYQKTSKARKTAPQLKTLPPTNESFRENVKLGILQTLVWYATLEPDPPDLDATLFG